MIQNFVYDPQSKYLFNRAYSFAIQTGANKSIALQYGTIGPNPAPLRVRFDIDKNSEGIGQGKIDVFNLSSASRQNIKKGYFVQLQAGYASINKILFTGAICKVHSNRDGSDPSTTVTSLEVGDGESGIVLARWDQSYPAGVTLVQILQDVAKAMSVPTTYNPIGVSAGVSLGIPNVIYNKGFVAHGSCADTLTKLLKPQGVTWNIQNGNLNIIPTKGSNGQSAIVVSAGTGLIGIPSNNNNILSFKSLLNPNIAPGGLVQIISTDNPSVNGIWLVQKAHFQGDSHDKKWEVDCEAGPVAVQGIAGLTPGVGFNYLPAVTQ